MPANWRIISFLLAGGLVFYSGCGKSPDAPDPEPEVNVSFSTRQLTPDAPIADISTGRIMGLVKWNGPPPQLERVPITRDANVCAAHGAHNRPSERLVVHPENGGVRDTVISLRGRFEPPASSEVPPPAVLNQRQCSYVPRVMVVPVGTRLLMTSDDPVGHNVRMSGAADLNLSIPQGGQSSRRLDQPGEIRLACDIHPWMSGYIHVVRHPYYAVTDAQGRFELANVPAGSHEIRLWHEPWQLSQPRLQVTKEVRVQAGQTTEVTFELSMPAATR